MYKLGTNVKNFDRIFDLKCLFISDILNLAAGTNTISKHVSKKLVKNTYLSYMLDLYARN